MQSTKNKCSGRAIIYPAESVRPGKCFRVGALSIRPPLRSVLLWLLRPIFAQFYTGSEAPAVFAQHGLQFDVCHRLRSQYTGVIPAAEDTTNCDIGWRVQTCDVTIDTSRIIANSGSGSIPF